MKLEKIKFRLHSKWVGLKYPENFVKLFQEKVLEISIKEYGKFHGDLISLNFGEKISKPTSSANKMLFHLSIQIKKFPKFILKIVLKRDRGL